MNQPSQSVNSNTIRQAIEIAVYLSLIFFVVVWCARILQPFVSIIMWGAIIAISAYTPVMKLQRMLGGRRKLAVILFALVGLTLVIAPAWMFAGSMIDTGTSLTQGLQDGTLKVSPPPDNVKEWPLVGERLFTTWSEAAANLQEWLHKYSDQVKQVGGTILGKVAGIGVAVLQFIFSILIAAVFLSSTEAVKSSMLQFMQRLAGKRGEKMLDLTVATIRSVTVGVLGIAFIQALLGGLGMFLVGVPAAGLWALIILVLVIAQLPALLVLGPVIIYVFSVESTTVALVFMVWSVVVSLSDMVLKPLMLGRGVEAPMLVILLGAIGGMILSGIIGLFVGAVVLALGYTLFKLWIDTGENVADSEPVQPQSTT